MVENLPVSPTVNTHGKGRWCHWRVTLSGRKERLSPTETEDEQRETERERDSFGRFQLKAGSFYNREEVGITGCKDGNCTCTLLLSRLLPGRSTVASIHVVKCTRQHNCDIHSVLSLLASPRLQWGLWIMTLYLKHTCTCVHAQLNYNCASCHVALAFSGFNTPLV